MKAKCINGGLYGFTYGKTYEITGQDSFGFYQVKNDNGVNKLMKPCYFDFHIKEEKKMKFEVGKKYRNKNTESIVEILFIGKQKAFGRDIKGNEYSVPMCSTMDAVRPSDAPWEEYHEPVKRWFNKYVNHGPFPVNYYLCGPFETEEKAKGDVSSKYQHCEYLGTVEIEF